MSLNKAITLVLPLAKQLAPQNLACVLNLACLRLSKFTLELFLQPFMKLRLLWMHSMEPVRDVFWPQCLTTVIRQGIMCNCNTQFHRNGFYGHCPNVPVQSIFAALNIVMFPYFSFYWPFFTFSLHLYEGHNFG